MSVQLEPFVDAQKAAEFLSISRDYVIELARKSKIPAYPLGAGRRKTWRFRLSELYRVFGPQGGVMFTSAALPRINDGQAVPAPEGE